jgi:hypothetical protein
MATHHDQHRKEPLKFVHEKQKAHLSVGFSK